MKRTVLYEEHLKLGAKIVEFGGWEMPLNYSPGILAEHLATRKFGGLFDISHMGRFRISGQDALPFMQYVLTNNAAALAPGQSQYTIIPTETGGAIDDAYLYRINGTEYILVVNAANTEKDWAHLQEYRSQFPRLILEDHTESIAMIAVQGPKTKALLEKITGDTNLLPEPIRNTLATTRIFDKDVPIARTGYTGEPIVFELMPPAEITARLWQTLVELGREMGVVPVGLGARDTLRMEAGLPLYGHELGTDIEGKEIPVYAIAAARVGVSLSDLKGKFIGRKPLKQQFKEIKLRREERLTTSRGKLVVPKTVMLLALRGNGVARQDCPVRVEDVLVGHVTSGTIIPYWDMDNAGIKLKPGTSPLRRAICLAYVDSDIKEGQKVEVIIRDKPVEAIVVRRHLGSEAAPYARPLLVEEAPPARPFLPVLVLEKLTKRLVRKVSENNTWRQQKAINLIPSEQTESSLVKLLTIADPSGRYAEHRRVEALKNTEAYYYQGTKFIAEIEAELVERLKKFFGCSEVETRLISGQMANATVFSGLVEFLNRANRRVEPRRMRSVMNHHIGKGGHLSAQPMGALRNFVSIDPVTEKWAVVNFPMLPDNPYRTDVAQTAELIAEHRPELIIFGRSMILHTEPVKEVAEIVADLKPRPIIMYDAAHVLGLLGPHFQEPLQEGADLVTGSTHKTFFGTQRGIIASNMSEGTECYELWESINKRAFPGSVSNHHLGTLLGLLLATYEMNTYGDSYQRQVIANAKAFASALKAQGLQVEGDPEVSYTETHQVILRVGYARGIEVADRLEANNIIVNYQALPDDEAFTASSGIRTGVQEMTRFGMKEADFAELAGYIAAVILKEKDLSQQVSSFRKRFTKMQYCLPEEQGKPLVDKLIDGLIKS